MTDKKRLFIKILKVELEETREDTLLLIEIYKSRYTNREIRQYVQLENEALLEREMHCLDKMVPELEKFPIDEYEDKDSFIQGLSVFLKSFVEENQFPKAVFLLAERKIQKVVKYIY
ncbi:hypothetical protein EXM22_06835 [Oceanispirochaeta crateris]|uniref:Uncharacterized protein n=1 Tax=Oceanispirochaeta crateris TaxID=2518645 RepID=A0A5C1QJR1_9SPIO|nr:hypothetical protein [Oceanispirochaeta crateris]QEN07717.1 hypothetical protein EXM22_06835 [Oceanispirochaeta crateris]